MAPTAPPGRQPAGDDAAPAGGGKPAAGNVSDTERRIIFSGQLEVVVKDFDAARAQLARLVGEAQGYFSKTEVTEGAGSRRTGVFTVKVPAARFQPTADAVSKLGVAVRNGTDSQDVTEEFVDVQARVRNLKVEEETFNRLLKDAAGRLDDVFKIREQIRQVRGDIERAEGRLKLLTALTALSTIQVVLREEANYVPPTVEPPPAPPTFGGRIGAAFAGSVDLLRQVGETVAIVVTAAAPWLPFVALAVLGLRWLGRLLARRTTTPLPRARRAPRPAEPTLVAPAEPLPAADEPGHEERTHP